ncbi:GntR family transcriptional regulator [Streptomyces sp. ventii]|uniref:GntR family transcriptional regulator n=1 Tax=Streptomyces spiramenti TaxID=2720606 RepID=A0ABX1ATF6_9ACTN|nr:GntR family transcriptional regulator [Streptomyces spiramenti]NJP69079.1 GntR family transcriptional regulator [Streptomyces spiramenti]
MVSAVTEESRPAAEEPGRQAAPQSPDHIAEALRARIRSGEFAPASRLPTQRELAEQFGASRAAIRHALAQLQREGYLGSRGRGAPAQVTAPAPDTPRSADVELADRIALAFQAEHVSIDAFSLTTETLNSALAAPLIAVSAGELRPRSISVRVLLPSPGIHPAFPRLVSDPADPRPITRLQRITRTFSASLRHQLGSLAERGLVQEVKVEIRTVEVTPLQKLYLLNDLEALTGYYQVVTRTVEFENEELEIYDVLGLSSKIFRASRDKDSRDEQDAAFVAESRLWFESLWSTIAEPVTLG